MEKMRKKDSEKTETICKEKMKEQNDRNKIKCTVRT